MVVTGLAVDVATVRVQAAAMGTGPKGDYRSAQRDQQPKSWRHLPIPSIFESVESVTKIHEHVVTRFDINYWWTFTQEIVARGMALMLIGYPLEQVGDADIDARLRQDGAGLPTVMGLVVKEMQQQAAEVLAVVAT